jgi:dihydrofolate reductase
MINLIAATTYYPKGDQFIIAADGKLPHESPEDMARFTKLTTGGVVIMGRKTFESIGQKPLPGRFNIVLSSQEGYSPPVGGLLSPSLEAALRFAELEHPCKEVWIIGGGQVYKEALEKDIPDRLYISEMRGHWEDDPCVTTEISSTVLLLPSQTSVITFPRVNMEHYKALYIDQYEDHALKILSKNSLDVL